MGRGEKFADVEYTARCVSAEVRQGMVCVVSEDGPRIVSEVELLPEYALLLAARLTRLAWKEIRGSRRGDLESKAKAALLSELDKEPG